MARPKRWGYWTQQRLIETAHAFAEINDRQPSASDFEPGLARNPEARASKLTAKQQHEWPSLDVVRYRFGSWSAYLQAAGFDPPPKPSKDRKQRSLTERQQLLLSWLDDEGETAGEIASAFADMAADPDLSFSTSLRWDRYVVLAALRRLERRGLAQQRTNGNRHEWFFQT